MAEIHSELDWEGLSDVEWNKKLDKRLEEFNEGRGEIAIPPGPAEILTGEYERGLNYQTVTEDLIRHTAYAIGDPNPIWRDPAYAAGTRWGGIIAQPMFETVIAFGSSFGERMRIPGVTRMNGGSLHKYFIPIRPGDKFSIYDKYEGVVEKQVTNKPYRMFIESVPRYYINQRDEVAAICVNRSIYMATPPGNRGKKQNVKVYQDKVRHHYSEEELEMIHKAYDDQLAGVNRRGAKTRYWEDVVEGEEIPTVIKGPVDVCDACARTMVSCYAYAFAIKWAAMRQHLHNHPIDPDTGEYMFLRDWHYTDHAAQLRGFPFANSAGAQNEMMLVHGITDWMGDDAFVLSMDSQERRMHFFGDMTYVKGKVAKKYVEDGQHLVLVNVWGENQDGVTHTKADFVVKLVSKAEYDRAI